MIRPFLLLIALLQLQVTSPPAENTFSRYTRPILASAAGQTCTILDATTFAHAAPSLRDLRLYATDGSGTRELPYVITRSEAQQPEDEPARILNLGTRGPAIEFDLAMPDRPYTEVMLDLAGKDFLATASVTGIPAPGSAHSTRLGDFNLFDLSSQHLSRSTSLPLQESNFPFLHVTLTASPAGKGAFKASPAMLRGASVPPSREAQLLFTVAAQTSALEQRGRDTIARFKLPGRVPIERVSFVLAPGYHANFSRDVLVSTQNPGAPPKSGDSVHGTIQRVKLTRGAREISEEQLSIPATLGANLQDAAGVEVAVENGDDPPLPITAVQLEMRERSLCFQALAGQQFNLFYGDNELPAPLYDFARTYTPSARSTPAQLGPEHLNPGWRSRPDLRPYTERHPHLLWLALLLVVGTLAFVAFHHPNTRLHS